MQIPLAIVNPGETDRGRGAIKGEVRVYVFVT